MLLLIAFIGIIVIFIAVEVHRLIALLNCVHAQMHEMNGMVVRRAPEAMYDPNKMVRSEQNGFVRYENKQDE